MASICSKEVYSLPNIKSAKKRVKVSNTKAQQNKMFKTSFKTVLKKCETALSAEDKTAAQAAYDAAVKKIDKAVAKGMIHKNAAARKKSRFAARLNKMGA